MKATTESLFLQPATRRPEPIVEIPLAGVLSVTPQPREGNHVGRAIGAGAAAGAAQRSRGSGRLSRPSVTETATVRRIELHAAK